MFNLIFFPSRFPLTALFLLLLTRHFTLSHTVFMAQTILWVCVAQVVRSIRLKSTSHSSQAEIGEPRFCLHTDSLATCSISVSPTGSQHINTHSEQLPRTLRPRLYHVGLYTPPNSLLNHNILHILRHNYNLLWSQSERSDVHHENEEHLVGKDLAQDLWLKVLC